MPVDPEKLAAAQAVLAEHRADQDHQRAEESRALVGKFFRYENRYSEGESWPLYAVVTGVGRDGCPEGWSFQLTLDGCAEVRINPSSMTTLVRGEEISAEEFWAAARVIQRDVTKRLIPPKDVLSGVLEIDAGLLRGKSSTEKMAVITRALELLAQQLLDEAENVPERPVETHAVA